ncbi:MAG TPA: hypothetical protein VGR10_05390, partial [Thermoleophilaceae bacterium]|nr:hypothetical protein [Thermoleophilaceae bacterium]
MRALLRLNLGVVAILAALATVVLLVLRGPALSAGEVLLAIAAGAVGMTLLSAWVVVALQGREGPSEEEVEHAVRRSERLASGPAAADPVEPSTGFDELVAEAIDRLPDEFRSLLEDTPVVVSRRGRREG